MSPTGRWRGGENSWRVAMLSDCWIASLAQILTPVLVTPTAQVHGRYVRRHQPLPLLPPKSHLVDPPPLHTPKPNQQPWI